MRKLGLILILLFTLSIVSAADFTISGKITPKTGVSPLVDGAYPAAFTFSDTTTYSGSVTITNGVFTADFSDIPNVATVLAASETVTMEITALGQIQTFSHIPLTTVPKAAVASAAHLSAPKSGSETNNPQLEIKYSGDTTTTDNGRYWNFRAGGSAIPTVFSYYNTKQLELNRELSTFYGELNINANAAALRLIGNDHTYMEFYPDGASTRKAYIGFGDKDNDNLDIANEIDGKGIRLLADHISLKGAVGSGDNNPLVIDDNSGLVVDNALSAGTTTLGATTTETLSAGTTTLGATTATSLYASNLLGIGAFYFDPARSEASGGADSWLRLLSGDNGAYKDLAVGKLYVSKSAQLLNDVEVGGNLIVDGDFPASNLEIKTYHSGNEDGTGTTLCSNSACTAKHGFFGDSSSGDHNAYCPPGTRAISCGARKSKSGEDEITCAVVGERQATWTIDVNSNKDWKKFFITCLGKRTDV